MSPDHKRGLQIFLEKKILDVSTKDMSSVDKMIEHDTKMLFFEQIRRTLASMLARGEEDGHELEFYSTEGKNSTIFLRSQDQRLRTNVDSFSIPRLAILFKVLNEESLGKSWEKENLTKREIEEENFRKRQINKAIIKLTDVLLPPETKR